MKYLIKTGVIPCICLLLNLPTVFGEGRMPPTAPGEKRPTVVQIQNVDNKVIQKSVSLNRVQSQDTAREYKLCFMKDNLPDTSARFVPAAEDLPVDDIERIKYIVRDWLQGPNDEEKKLGFYSIISTTTVLESCSFENMGDVERIVILQFNTEMLKGLDEYKVSFIHDQIAFMLQHSGIQNIVGTKILVKGKAVNAYLQ